MSVPYVGDFAEDATVYLPFNTFTSNDPQASSTITNLADADIKVHKDAGLTQIATDGATIAIDYDSITGNHMITIDTSVHADYAIGSDYHVRIEGTTVDAGTINAWVGSFSIENRFREVMVTNWNGVALATTNPLPNAAADAAGGLPISDAGALDMDALNTASIRLTAARAQVLDDWINAGRLDAILDIIAADVVNIDGAAMRGTDSAALASVVTESRMSELDQATAGKMANQVDIIQTDTTTDIPATITTAQNDLNLLTGADGATLASLQPNYAPNVVVPDAAGVAPTAVEVRQEIDSNSTQLAIIAADTTTDIPALIAALNDITVADLLTTAMTESYAADNVAPTLTQAVMQIQQMLQEASSSGTTLTVKKLDGSTTAMTFTLDNAVTPTSITRTT